MVWIQYFSVVFLLQLCAVSGEECPSANPVRHFDIQRESKPSVHDDLTMKEIEDVYDYMAGLREFSGLKEASTLTIESSYIYMIERHPPPKSEVLAYQAGTGPKPKRFALVIMFRGDLPTPVIEEYKVGPLPNIEGYEKLQIAGRDSIDYIKRSYFANADLAGLQALIRRELGKIDHLLSQVLGGYRMNNCTTKCLTWFPGMPGEFVLGDRSMWVFIHRQHEGFYVLPIGLQFRVDMDMELDVKDWKVNFVYFRGDTFESIDSMAATYTPPSNNDPLILVDDNNLYSSLKHRGDPLPEKKQRGPRAFMPDGQRFTVDGHHVEWQGWSFDFNLRTRIGLQVHDVLFKNEKVAYELSLSEIGIMYSGASPLPMHTAYVDSTFHLGWESYELVVGVDCPDHATYFDFAHYFNFKPMLYKNSVCIFEHDSGIPLRRHYESNRDGTYSFVQGMPGNVLKLKAVMSVYNYEYLLDYTFHQNGAIEVTVTLSGYILSSFYSGEPADDRYGFEVSPEGLGSIHNHMVHLKADLDILGEKNRFETFDIKVDDIRDPADASKNIYVHKFERNLRETEQDATWEYNMNTPKYLIVYNDEKDNPFGNKRGYRIVPISVNAQLLPQEWTVEKSFSWARYQAAVTKQKDSESRASSIYNMADISDPVVKFQDFIDDDESIVDEDLVAWITLGSFHIPRTEDIPIVTTPAFSLRYYLLPYNYFNEDPSMASRDNIRVTPKSNGEKNVQYVGVSPDETCSDMVTASASGISAKSNILAGLLVLLILGKLL